MNSEVIGGDRVLQHFLGSRGCLMVHAGLTVHAYGLQVIDFLPNLPFCEDLCSLVQTLNVKCDFLEN